MIYLNVGSNLDSKFGSRFENISIAVNLLVNSKIRISRISNFYETPSYPNKNLPRFLNIGITGNFKNTSLELLKIINMIEKKLGRTRKKKNDPRVIDIDIIDFKGQISDSKNLILPHPKSHLRNFVLYPILEIDPKWSHPVFKKNPQAAKQCLLNIHVDTVFEQTHSFQCCSNKFGTEKSILFRTFNSITLAVSSHEFSGCAAVRFSLDFLCKGSEFGKHFLCNLGTLKSSNRNGLCIFLGICFHTRHKRKTHNFITTRLEKP